MSKEKETSGSPTVLKTVGVYREDGGHAYQQGIKGGSTRTFSKNGCRHSHNGYGGSSITIPSGLFLEFINGQNQVLPVSVKKEFREAGFQRLTDNVMQRIKSTMPSEITLEETSNGVRVNHEIMQRWTEDVKNKK